MDILTEPREIEDLELYDFPWQAPLTEVEAGCFGSRRHRETYEPEDLNVIERKLFEANAADFAWVKERTDKFPAYLTKYFITRYITIFTNKGRAEANTFLREKLAPAAERAVVVMRRYQKLPTTQKVALLSKELGEEDPFHSLFFTEHGEPDQLERKQISFDFEAAEKDRKPVKNRFLAELEKDELKEMAFQLTQIVNGKLQMIAHHISQLDVEAINQERPEDDPFIPEVEGYNQLAQFVAEFGIKPPRKYKTQTPISASNDLSRMKSDKWWLGCLVAHRKIMREHLAIAMGQVSNHASPYASWDCIREHKAQQKRNWDAIQNMLLRDEETEEEFELKDLVLKSVSNPAIRRHELMVRCRGCEDIGNELGLQGLFLTLTAPSKYHNSYKKGGFISHWDGSSPRDAQQYLNKTWQRIRTNLGNKELRWFGVRVAEPHHDGTPHWHLLIWVKPEEKEKIAKIFIDYATQEDKHELMTSGEFNHKPRCDVGEIDPKKGTATGYIAKYISKNIDGYAMDDLVSDETGKPVKDMAKNVSAWKSRWNIRQFQFFGGAPVTTYRELRRFANNDKASFMQYLTQLNYQELLNVYEFLEVKAGRKFMGPPISAELVATNPKFDSKYLFLLLGEYYQPDMEHENHTVADVMKAADKGNWHGYIMGQGGPFVKRADLLVTNVYEELPFASPHGETVKKLKGFDASGVFMKTRLRDFVITTKAKPQVKKQVEVEFDKPTPDPSTWTFKKRTVAYIEVPKGESSARGSEATLIGSSAASRSSVNNCTLEPNPNTGRVLNPDIEYEIQRLIDEFELASSFRSNLLSGRWLGLTKTKSIKLRFGANERQPDHLVYRNTEQKDLSWLDEPEPAEPTQLNEDEYTQPELSFFADDLNDYPEWGALI